MDNFDKDNASIDRADIQRLVAYGLKSQWVRHIILRIESASKAKEFLKHIIDEKLIDDAGGEWDAVADASKWKMNVSFTYSGFQRLELNKNLLLNTFPTLAKSFVQGASLRGQAQGDVGVSAPSNWEAGFESSNAHLVLTVYGNEETSNWEEILGILRNIKGAEGVAGWENVQLGRKRGEDKEVFGFKDGISQPYFRGVSHKPLGPIPESLKFEPGDLLLGYENSIGENFWDDELLPEGSKDFFKNGTFAALRKIKQDLGLFNKVTEKLAEGKKGKDGKELESDYIKAKLFGRWPNGAVVKPGQETQPETSDQSENDFDFSDDPHGFGCPVGSHIRRINHRSNKDVFPNRHRAIQRRGLPYGGKVGEEEGLLALFICSSLESQFEFVMGDWVEGSPRLHKGARALNSDPVIGNQDNGVKEYFIPREKEETIRLAGLKQFTTTKGMLYLFYPSMTALGRMAILDKENDEFVYSKKSEYAQEYGHQKRN